MNEGVIPGRYAMALFKYANDNNVTTHLYDVARVVEESFVSHPELQKTLMNPVMSVRHKMSLLKAASGNGAGKYYENFIRLVIDKKREEYTREIFLKYQQIYRKKNNIAQVLITTAMQLPEEIMTKIKSLMQKKVEHEIEFVYKIDASIIGGFILKVDSMQLDASVNRELKEMRLKLVNSSKTV
ncbi:MAG: F0F1 ATP synthase subunit delta [Bacteroidales bacterium]